MELLELRKNNHKRMTKLEKNGIITFITKIKLDLTVNHDFLIFYDPIFS